MHWSVPPSDHKVRTPKVDIKNDDGQATSGQVSAPGCVSATVMRLVANGNDGKLITHHKSILQAPFVTTKCNPEVVGAFQPSGTGRFLHHDLTKEYFLKNVIGSSANSLLLCKLS